MIHAKQKSQIKDTTYFMILIDTKYQKKANL